MTGCPTNYDLLTAHSKIDAPPPAVMPLVINIDNDFSLPQKELIASAMDAWERVSGGVIKFIPVWNKPKPGPLYKHYDVMEGEGIFMWHISANDHFHVNEKLFDRMKGICGLYVPGTKKGLASPSDDPNAKVVYVENAANIIILKSSDMNNEQGFYNAVLHELGHLLRLKHSDEKMSIMYPHVSKQTCISQWDTAPLCEIYECSPEPECLMPSNRDLELKIE